MAIITTAALATIGWITLGVTALTTAGTAACYYATEDDRARAEYYANKTNISAFAQTKKDCQTLRMKLQAAKLNLENARRDFLNGGYVIDNKPLESAKFKVCIERIDSAISSINLFIDQLTTSINELTNANIILSQKYNIN